ncbi:piggyBac transposable element-derived protein 3-like [Diaphorina citri]|uniref:PiggyBac transposable element-derived protein 3-like n=1 Tax=Diaphorina citri TaxID=121845 RepID=A0A1S3DGN1_DIACI|nr:piggyBac transposable element-derived protein 3-like [Diaphorina citri]
MPKQNARPLSPLSTHQILELLEADLPLGDIDVFITPPNDNGADTDADSGEEDERDYNRLNRAQLMAEGELQINGESFEDANLDSSPEASQDFEDSEASPSSAVEDSTGNARQDTEQEAVAESRPSSSRQKHSLENTMFKSVPSIPRLENMKWAKRDLVNPLKVYSEYPKMLPLRVCSESHPLEFFEMFITENLVENVVKQSVLYAVSKNEEFTLSVGDLYCYFGILYLSGYVQVPRRRMYWEEGTDSHNILVSNSMRRNRFDNIMKYLHVADNSRLNKNDKMAKLRPMMNEISNACLKNAFPETDLSIDESMIPYFGRHSTKQCIRNKPVRFGYKAWVLASKQGYCLSFDIYQGRRDKMADQANLGESVILSFTNTLKREYPKMEFSLYFDNFFSSLAVIHKLKEDGFGATGTIRENRLQKCPLMDTKEMKKSKCDRGTFDYKTAKGVILVKWKDNAVVTLGSNQYGIHPIQTAKRFSREEKKQIDVPQPHIVSMYNKNMGGVDLMDNNISNYRIGIRGKKWYTPILFWLLDVAMNNAWILSRQAGMTMDNLSFRREVVRALLMKYGSAPLAPGRRSIVSVPDPLRVDHRGHMIITGQARRRCVMCRNKTVKACRRCDVALHDKCFEAFHVH